MAGTIQILHNNKVVQFAVYTCESDVEKFLMKWKRLYGKGWERVVVNRIADATERDKDRFLYKKGDLPKTFKRIKLYATNRVRHKDGKEY